MPVPSIVKIAKQTIGPFLFAVDEYGKVLSAGLLVVPGRHCEMVPFGVLEVFEVQRGRGIPFRAHHSVRDRGAAHAQTSAVSLSARVKRPKRSSVVGGGAVVYSYEAGHRSRRMQPVEELRRMVERSKALGVGETYQRTVHLYGPRVC